jgi:hypothetical protein
MDRSRYARLESRFKVRSLRKPEINAGFAARVSLTD